VTGVLNGCWAASTETSLSFRQYVTHYVHYNGSVQPKVTIRVTRMTTCQQ